MDMIVTDNNGIIKYKDILNEWYKDIYYTTIKEWNVVIPGYSDITKSNPKDIDDIINEDKNAIYYLGLVDNKLVGYIAVNKMDGYYINCLYIKSEYRRKGYARQLLQYVLDILRKHDKVFLNVSAINTSALKLYESLGFQTFNLELGINKK